MEQLRAGRKNFSYSDAFVRPCYYNGELTMEQDYLLVGTRMEPRALIN